MNRRSTTSHGGRNQQRADNRNNHYHGLLGETETAMCRPDSNPELGDGVSDVILHPDTGDGVGVVEHWLSSVSRRGIVPPETMTGQHHGQHHPNVLGWRPHGLLAQGVPQQRYKRTRSRDSSIIIDSAKKAGWSPSTAAGHRPNNTIKPNDTFVLADTLPTKFDKRSRHRTREDRDERPAPSKVPSKEMGFSRREVMDDFRSDAILNDRLTLQPCLTPGLFQNGRISSPKPVEELAYNSMISFLEHRPLRQSWQQQRSSEVKGRKRRERELEEMGTVFGQKVIPSDDVRRPSRGGYENWRGRDRLSDYYNGLPEANARSIRAMKDEADPRNSKTRQRPDGEANSRSSQPLRSSSRPISRNRQTPVQNHTDGRSVSSTPEPVREALKQTGVFNKTRLPGSISNSKASCRLVDDVHHHDRNLEDDEDDDVHIVLPGAVVERPRLIRYTGKGTMTNIELSLSPDGPKTPGKLEVGFAAGTPQGSRPSKIVVGAAGRSTQQEMNNTSNVQKTHSEPQWKEDISTRASPKAPHRVPGEASTMNVSSLPSVSEVEPRPTDAAWPHDEVAPNPHTEEKTASKSQNRGIRRIEFVMSDVSRASLSAKESRETDHYVPKSSAICDESTFFPNRRLMSDSNSGWRNGNGPEEETTTRPYAFPRSNSRGSQPKGLRCIRAPTTPEHRSMPGLNPSEFQYTESMIDYIARIEQDVLRREHTPRPQGGPFRNNMAYQQRANDFAVPETQVLWESALIPEKHDWNCLGDASISGPRAKQLPETEFYTQKNNLQQSMDQRDTCEQEEMHAFWRPNYFNY
ncbi:hypothetical protein CH63R_11706 [Colletotrichum higginsianum IMI 349063]|uniref:Uncharacterized protein n=1 Tax=Colletotrichum higginsianum (strain IMI 349063) TaxID=759273 RepID=A0A1B7XYZ7_COLHI|nr:hypothetical protein CH63R_11706 [Colletotrichum higginsianum IMI 349063]OBR05003.1 hypothetical protein CH63R_11706 [Colletotrichum higginsianum IMI 349063]